MSDSHIIIAGQSNALGYGNNGKAPYAPTPRVQIWADTDGDGDGDAWTPMAPGTNTGAPANPKAWGPEVEVAKRWLADHSAGTLWIVKSPDTVKGSTGLAKDAKALDWSPASAGEMYDRATAAIRAAQDSLKGGASAFKKFDVLMWMQGEEDAASPAKAAAYGDNLTAFLARARSDWNVTEVVAGRITDSPALPDNPPVRAAQWEVDAADGHLTTFPTIGFDMQSDTIHYSASGHLALGSAFYDGWF